LDDDPDPRTLHGESGHEMKMQCLQILKHSRYDEASTSPDDVRVNFEIFVLILEQIGQGHVYKRVGTGMFNKFEVYADGYWYEPFHDVEEGEIVLV
jgi:hypothetical protein